MRAAFAAATVLVALTPSALADSDVEVAKLEARHISPITTMSLSYFYDDRIGPLEAGSANLVHLHASVPIPISERWIISSRTLVRFLEDDEVEPGAGTHFGLSDSEQTLFLSPRQAGPEGFTWGIGPVVTSPAAGRFLGFRRWGLGPSAVAVEQKGSWTACILTRQIWSLGDSESRRGFEITTLLPAISYTTDTAWTLLVESDTHYFWRDQLWSVPIGARIIKTFKLGEQTVSMGAGTHYWVTDPVEGPHGWGFRFSTTLFFPDSRK